MRETLREKRPEESGRSFAHQTVYSFYTTYDACFRASEEKGRTLSVRVAGGA